MSLLPVSGTALATELSPQIHLLTARTTFPMGARGVYLVNLTTLSVNSTVRLQQIQLTPDALSTKGKEYRKTDALDHPLLVLWTCFCFIPDHLPQNGSTALNIGNARARH